MELDELDLLGDLDLDFGFDLDMLYGSYNHSLDTKGRVIIPARFRKCLGETVVVTRGSELDCLSVYSAEEWRKKLAKLRNIPANDLQGRKLLRYYLGSVGICPLDKQGKILIPQSLRDLVPLGKEVTIVGMLDRVEIWGVENWNKSSNYESSDELRDSIFKFDI